MMNNVAVNTCIGIVFVILLYSLLATILQEIVARWFGLRGRLLLKAIRRMLEDEQPKSRFTFINFFIEIGRDIQHYFNPFKTDSFAKAFFKDSTIKGLAESSWTSKPSYLNAADFSQTMIRLLKAESLNTNLNPTSVMQGNLYNNSFTGFKINPATIQYLNTLLANSHADINRFTILLEEWFENVMDRSTGWYKRQTQFILFIIGLFIAAIFNADLIAITKIVANDGNARDALVSMATNTVKDYKIIIDSLNARRALTKDTSGKDMVIHYIAISDSNMTKAYKKVNEDIDRVNEILGLGRTKVCTIDSARLTEVNKFRDSLCQISKLAPRDIHYLDSLYNISTHCSIQESPYQAGRWKIWGWLLMAISISLGAPFWFDLLNKIMLLRSSGQKPKEEDKAKSKNDQPTVKPVG